MDTQRLPAPPPATPAPTTPGNRVAKWREVFAIIGIIGGFFTLLTIPGWFGIRAWRRYKRGEGDLTGWTVWGIIVTAFVALAVIIGAFSDIESADAPTTGTDSTISEGLGTQDASDDVEFHIGPKGFNDCSVEFEVLTCTLDITNHSGGTSDYYIEGVVYNKASTNIGWGNATAQNVAGGGSAQTELTVVLNGGNWDTVEITEVQRTAS